MDTRFEFAGDLSSLSSPPPVEPVILRLPRGLRIGHYDVGLPPATQEHAEEPRGLLGLDGVQ
eukprot:1715743-Lingulodinium_polyedra.AAC.1